ncbi:GatB/YqeY domain-containing protein [Cellulomonas sp.]|uniref:GatB/YqeY domain-containing protein n=1 Tax=Cellulomonas sp. TaxID=40001 RepID=UPI001B1F67FD|nr:GatB/YqeY domain-containing protein [Cellulomonas sp.]MBO9554346.1 GatB/YqeY domain-containing protein [Cellulomonas sp.]
MTATTLDQLTADLTTAMKARDTDRVGVLRQAIGAVRAEAKAGPVEKDLTEEDVLRVLTREVKKRRESAQIYTDAGAAERAATETAEADVIETYLPARLSDDELAALVGSVVADLGATSIKDMGGVMKEATARAAGAADGKKLSALVRAALAG